MRPLTLTTQRHPVAASMYVVMAFLGIVYLTGDAQAKSLQSIIGTNMAHLWAWSLAIFGFGAVGSIVMPAKWIRQGLFIEAASCLALTLLNGSYVAAIIALLGLEPLASEAIFTFITLGFATRSVQAFREAGRVAKALSNPTPSEPTLAEPPKHQGW